MNLTELKTKLEIAQNQIDEAYKEVEKLEKQYQVSKKDRFREAVNIILKWEGGYVNHPSDPGGETNFGISKRSFPHLDIKNLTKQQASNIYRANYWNPIKGSQMPYPIALFVFDLAVNSGPARARKMLQQCLGVAADGVIGPITLRAANEVDQRHFVEKFHAMRESFYRGLSTWETFGKGWMNRINDIKEECLKEVT